MSIVRDGYFFNPTCDICGEELPGEFEFADAVRAKKDAGWQSQKLPDGSWQDLCPECQNKPGDVFRKG